MLPNAALASLSDMFTSKAEELAANMSAETARSDRLLGKVEVANVTNGKSTFSLQNTIDSIAKYTALAGAAIAVTSTIKTLAEGAMEMFKPGTVDPATNTDQQAVDTLSEEINSSVTPGEDEFTSKSLEIQKAASRVKLGEMQSELNETLQTLDQVGQVIEKRATGEYLNPVVNVEDMGEALENIISNLEQTGAFSASEIAQFRGAAEANASSTLDNYDKFVKDRIVTPYSENKFALNIMRAQLLGLPEDAGEQPIFRTVYGPPVSNTGQFILSRDGIYYDSRSGSIPHITAEKITSESWKLRYASNRGGQGQIFDGKKAERLTNTVFSDDFKDETGKVLSFYKYDDVLENIRNDRELQVQDVAQKVQALIDDGYDASSAIVKNYQESYAAVAHTYDRKIKKRKKQLQVAALFGMFGVTEANSPQGEGVFYRLRKKDIEFIQDDECGETEKVKTISYQQGESEEDYDIEYIPRIPVNDFSYLGEIGMIPSVEAQEDFLLHSEDMDDTTAPISPIMLERGPGAAVQAIPEMSIPFFGTADWVNTSGDTDLSSFASGTTEGILPYIRTLDDSIVTDGLVLCYNFLEPDAVVNSPSTDTFGVRNFADSGYPLNAKMVGEASSIFLSGVSIPYLTGSLIRPDKKYGGHYSYLEKGSYVRLPNNYRSNKVYPQSQAVDNLMYNDDGWTMDFWAHVPDLSSGLTTDHRYRLVAANENCGDPVLPNSIETLAATTASPKNAYILDRRNRTKGMVIGWRDRGDPGTAQASGLEFVVLPTISQNNYLWGKSVAIAENVSGQGSLEECRNELGFKVGAAAQTESGYTIGEASGGFAHYSIACSQKTDTISLYVNGQFLASSLISTAFDIPVGTALNIPSRISEGHYHDPIGEYGEKLYDGTLPAIPVLTPWILGGGFTDGISESPFTASLDTTLPGFLGTNTNSNYFSLGSSDPGGGPIGQHSNVGASIPGLGGYTKSGVNFKLARSGLDGHLGSFKMYAKPLSTVEVSVNYNAQSPYFGGIKLPKRLL